MEKDRLADGPFCVAQIYILADYKRGSFCYTEGIEEAPLTSIDKGLQKKQFLFLAPGFNMALGGTLASVAGWGELLVFVGWLVASKRVPVPEMD